MEDAQQHYFRLLRPSSQTLPIVVDVPHSGEWIPDEVAREMIVKDQVLRRDLDLYVDQIWQDAPSLGATLIASNVSRYVLDLNRASDDVSPKTVKGAKAIQRPGYYQDRGVVWRTTTDGTPVMASAMTQEAFARRIATFHTPYHAAIEAECARVRAQFGFCILVDGHSMPSRGRSGHTDPGSRRADIVPGDVEGLSCHASISSLIHDHFRMQGFSVKPNTPYKGGFITRHFGRPNAHIHAIQIEINRELYMNEQTFVIKTSGLERLREACAALLPELAKLDASKL